MDSSLRQKSLRLHAELKGKIAYGSKFPLKTKEDLSLLYTPGVAEPCTAIARNPKDVYKYTGKGNLVMIVTDGSAVLGLGDIGPEAALPVMEGKALLFKKFGNVDAIPICLATKDVNEIVETVVRISPGFGGINLEDISAPRCFEIERQLKEKLDIPVFHDDQHGTAIVTLAALKNALRVVEKELGNVKIVLSGAGAAGTAITKLLLSEGARNMIVCDSDGIISAERKNLDASKQDLLSHTNPENVSGSLRDALKNADVFLGVSAPNLLDATAIETMNPKAIVFAMANPVPEIMPDEARRGGAAVIATGRSDFPNQVNNVLAFPGIFRGAFDARTKELTTEIYLAAAKSLANLIPHPTAEKILPGIFDPGVSEEVAKAVREADG